jgi:hypothetical protein
MDVWDWVDDCRQRFQAAGDEARLRLTGIHPIAYKLRETDPDRALALFEEGRRQAQALNEPWWVLFFEHWKSTALIHFQRDFRTILDHAVRLTLEVRKPLYEQHPLRIAIFDDLVAAYLGIDPVGYAEHIQQAIDYLDQAVPNEPEGNRYLLLARKRRFAMEQGDLDLAWEISQRELTLADQDREDHRSRHFSVFIHDSRCEIAFRRKDWELMGTEAKIGEELARKVGHQLELSELIVWQALAAWHRHEQDAAEQLYRTARSRFERLGMPSSPAGFDALAAYHELVEDWPCVLAVRHQELKTIGGKGRLHYEARCRLKRLRLMALVGPAPVEEIEAARAIILQLRQPDKYLQQLSRYLR